MTGEAVKFCPTVGELPDGWQVKRLGSFCRKIGTGATPRGGSEVYLDSRTSHALVRSQHVFDRHFDSSGLAYISEQHAQELKNAELQSGDVLLNITGDGVTFGRACIVPDRVLPACVNQHVSIIRPDNRECDPGYLLSVLTHPATKGYIESFNSGGSRRAITKGHIESFAIPLPPLAEQKAIAAVLGSLDDKIELNGRMNATLEAMARALFQSWFVDFDPVRAKLDGRKPVGIDPATAALFPAHLNDSSLGRIPAGWQLGRFGDLCKLKRGHDLPANVRQPGSIPVISSSGIFGWHIETEVRGPGVVTGRYGTIGKVFYVETDYWPLNTTLYVEDFKGNPPRFIFHALGEINFSNYSDKAAVPGVNRNHLHEEPTVIAPLELREAFARAVSPLWAQHSANERQSRTLATLRDTLLPKLLSGELTIKS